MIKHTKQSKGQAVWRLIEIINNKARHNLIDAKYQQMAF